MSKLNEKFNGLAPVGFTVLYCPSGQLDDAIASIVTESYHDGVVSLFVLPCQRRREGQIVNRTYHVSDERLFNLDGTPTDLALRNGFWVFPDWSASLLQPISRNKTHSKDNG